MDTIDKMILTLLKENSRETASSIAQKIHLSVSSTISRIKKLEDMGIIENYTIILNEKKAGLDVTAMMEISLEHPKYYDSFIAEILHHPNIVDCYYLTGDFDFNLKIVCESSERLEEIHRTLKSLSGVGATRTQFVLKEVKNIYSPVLVSPDVLFED